MEGCLKLEVATIYIDILEATAAWRAHESEAIRLSEVVTCVSLTSLTQMLPYVLWSEVGAPRLPMGSNMLLPG